MTARTILLVALQNGGHNPGFIQSLAEYWSEHAVPGRLTILVSSTFPAAHLAAAQAIANLDTARLRLLPMSTEDERYCATARPAQFARWLPTAFVQRRLKYRVRRWNEWNLCARYVRELRAGHCLFLNLDFYQFSATWNRSLACGFSGVFHNLMFHYPVRFPRHISPRMRVEAARQAVNMRLLLQNRQMGTLYCLDPWAAETVAGLGGPRAAVHLPVPAGHTFGQDVQADAESIRQRHGIERGRIVLLMFGGISARRGAKVVLAALESLTPAEAARICLLLIGRQTQGDGTAHAILAARESLAAQIIARDEFIADTEIGPYHELADVVLVTHVRHIGVSVSLVHAAQARRPVLASDFGLVGELTRRYGLGTTVDTADPKALAAAIRDLVIQSRPLPIDAQRMALFAEQNSPLRYAQTLVESLPLPPVDAPVTRR